MNQTNNFQIVNGTLFIQAITAGSTNIKQLVITPETYEPSNGDKICALAAVLFVAVMCFGVGYSCGKPKPTNCD